MAKRILVTGADGFIGSHLTERLVREGYNVRAFVAYNSLGSWGWLDHCETDVKGKFEIFAGDIRDPHGVRRSMVDCDVVMHLAALIAIPYSYHSPDTYVDTNIKGTLNVLQAAREVGCHVIHTSTSEVYGSAQFVPINESHPQCGQSPYSATKIAADQLAYSFYASFATPVTIVRPFNTYGPRQSARAIIPTVISQLASGKRQIRLGAIFTTRDFNFVSDTVAGFLAAMKLSDGIGDVFNIGSNFEIRIDDMVQLVGKIMGIEVDILTEDVRLRPKNSEVERLWADNTKAKQILGWVPEYSGIDGLERGLKKTINWFDSPRNQKMYRPDTYSL